MEHQAREMVRTRLTMREQLKTMQHQVTQMVEQTNFLEQSVKAVISKERARIKVKEPIPLSNLLPNAPLIITFEIFLEGLTPPTILIFSPMILTDHEIKALTEGKKFIHFWGSITYRDVFYDVISEERETAFRWVCGYQPSFARSGNPRGIWLPCGTEEGDHRET
jgi:hypothetical protein